MAGHLAIPPVVDGEGCLTKVDHAKVRILDAKLPPLCFGKKRTKTAWLGIERKLARKKDIPNLKGVATAANWAT
jgi:hypothetical protein